jgi:hypothetical protein
MLKDIAILTGGTAISEDLGIKLENGSGICRRYSVQEIATKSDWPSRLTRTRRGLSSRRALAHSSARSEG